MSDGAPSGPVRVRSLEDGGEPSHVNVGKGERLASMVAGGLLALAGLRRISLSGVVLAISGAALVYRGASGHCAAYRWLDFDTSGTDAPDLEGISTTVTVGRPRAEVYAAWRAFENLPRCMRHLESVTRLDDRRYHWVASASQGLTSLEWDVELVEDRANELIAWQSLPGAQVHHNGWISFRDAPEGNGAELHVELIYRAVGGEPGGGVADPWLTPAMRRLITEDIHRFKRWVEKGAPGAHDDES